MLGGVDAAAWEYEWAQPATVAALSSLLCARILQPSSKIKHVLAHLNKVLGQDLIYYMDD